MKKIIILLVICLSTLTGCSAFKSYEGTTHHVIKYENISIEDFNQMVEVATSKAASCSVAVIASANSIISTPSLGSGVIVGKTSMTYYVLTNRHVITNKGKTLDNIKIYFSSDESDFQRAEIIYFDEKVDIALLKFTANKIYNVATITNEDTINKGSFVIAYGSPYSLEFFGTANFGIVSSERRELSDPMYNSELECKNIYIQHDAPINSGNSGGGLFDIYGNLIAINTLKLNGKSDDIIQGMGFAIPIEVILQIDAIKPFIN